MVNGSIDQAKEPRDCKTMSGDCNAASMHDNDIQAKQSPNKRKVDKKASTTSSGGKSLSAKSTPKKAKDASPQKGESTSVPPNKSKSSRPANQPSIGSFFTKMKSTESKKSNPTKSESRSSTAKKDKSNCTNESTGLLTSKVPLPSSKPVAKTETATKSTVKKPKTATKKANQSTKSSNKKTGSKPAINIPEDEDILAIVLGTHKETVGEVRKLPSNALSRNARRQIHLPALITSDAQFKRLKSTQRESSGTDTISKNTEKSQMPASSPTKKAKKDPNKPKNARNAFIFFSRDHRPTVAKNNPEFKPNDVAKEVGRLYRELSPEAKKKYEDLASADTVRYKEEMKDYNAKKSHADMNLAKEDEQTIPSTETKADATAIDDAGEGQPTLPADVPKPTCGEEEGQLQEVEMGVGRSCSSDKNSCPQVEIVGSFTSCNGENNSDTDVNRMETQNEGSKHLGNEEESKTGNDIKNTEKMIDFTDSNDKSEERNNCSKNENEKEQNLEGDCDITLGSGDDEMSCDQIDQEDASNDGMHDDLDDDDVTVEMEMIDEPELNNEFNEDDEIHIAGEDEDLTAEEEKAVDIVEVEASCVKEPDVSQAQDGLSNEEVQPVVNLLQPRKKVRDEIVHTLQPRKKARTEAVNTLQPRKKLKTKEIQPRKNIQVNELTPRKKAKASPPLTTPDTILSKASNTSSVELKVTQSPKPIILEIDDKVDIVKTSIYTINELKPRKKLSKSTSLSDDDPKNSSLNKSPTPKLKSPRKQNVQVEISVEDKKSLEKYHLLRSRYVDRAQELVDRAMQGSIEEESWHSEPEDVSCNPIDEQVSNLITEFNDDWIPQLAIIVQGSTLPLQELSIFATKEISEGLDHGEKVNVDTIAEKIKILASRTQYLIPIPGSSGSSSTAIAPKVEIFNDSLNTNMWRWELISIDLLPEDKIALVKKARAARKKLGYHQKAIIKLINSIDAYEALLKKASKSDKEKQRRIARISAEEEKVLKYEREEEKVRLQREAKAQKEKEKAQKQIEKEAEKDRKKEELQKKQVEKARLEAEKHKQKEEATKKQKARMMSFFKSNNSKPKGNSEQVDASKGEEDLIQDIQIDHFDSADFWKKIGCGTTGNRMFTKLSSKARKSRRRKVGKVNVRVFTTALSDNPFDQQPYDEERMISVRNRKKYLSFHEDYRPPYYGTWSKPRSKTITGRNPFAQDTSFLNYEIDSEAEWEEGDNEQGDDCSIDDNDDDELEGEVQDTTKYDYQDGWITKDDDLALEDDDDEAKEMRKKKAEAMNGSCGSRSQPKAASACIIAPMMGGKPQFLNEAECPNLISDFVEGIEVEEAREVLSIHDGEILQQIEICLDPFPPMKNSETKASESKNQHESVSKKPSNELSQEDLKIFAKFVHKCTLKSKDLIIEEFRLKHKEVVSSRARLNRKLDLIASKRRLKNGGGVVWEVKKSSLESLDLGELMISNEDLSDEESTARVAKSKVPSSSPVSTSKPPVLVSPALEKSVSKKRKEPGVSEASKMLLADFLKKRKRSS